MTEPIPASTLPNKTDSTSTIDNSTNKEKDKQKALEKKKKRRDRRKKKAKRAKKNEPKTKVVVRRLPPNLPEDVFMNAVQQWTTDDLVDFKTYIPGKLAKSKAKESTFSRAYFHMKSIDAVIAFHQGFDGHIFMDSRGNESRAVVEFAPYQGIPKEHKAPDVRQGTIDEDPDYIKFLESLKADQTKETEGTEPVDGPAQIERLENRLALVTAQALAQEQANKPKTTPLLEHLRAQKAAKAAKAAKKKAAAKTLLKKKAAATDGQDNNNNVKTGTGEKKSRSRKKKDKSKQSTEGSKGKDESPSTSSAPATNSNKKKEDKSATSGKKEGNSKPKRSRNRDKKPKPGTGDATNNQQPVIKILGRQDGTPKAT
ncbi:Smg-4/UPF3 family-domain-containing protein [Halteromyces radiatus]|uniref:Smg-4/UPF3 family-domain-containing protein n=1 Tax=Halteromyces radiatus TaxID=101107 RepID=UPI002220BBAF|nr:Smg-4/UPF3 family-domain-containing protein [Halteromyces radiatus]KAI8097716.1 Smg-4/UPF3 family-domain-containing protein [Halteromyces radiatus]